MEHLTAGSQPDPVDPVDPVDETVTVDLSGP
jgi:hypothetical protein